ncbi:MAG TPA: sugar ABC transporter ATP-binding protein, partial [Terriglobales bacterium]
TSEVFDQIVDFAGIEEFMDEPIRTYSSGMILRLAFSVAVHIDPEVLLIDEVLAVGDQSFQAKSFAKIHELRRQGKSLLCVSHATGMVQSLCDQAIWLDHGELMMADTVGRVCEAYAGKTAVV